MRKRLLTLLALAALSAFSLTAFSQPASRPGWLGLAFRYQRNGTPPNIRGWMYIRRVVDNGPAAKAGLRQGDVVWAINDAPLKFRTDEELLDYFARLRPGDRLQFAVVSGTKRHNATLTATEMSEQEYLLWQKNAPLARSRANKR